MCCERWKRKREKGQERERKMRSGLKRRKRDEKEKKRSRKSWNDEKKIRGERIAVRWTNSLVLDSAPLSRITCRAIIRRGKSTFHAQETWLRKRRKKGIQAEWSRSIVFFIHFPRRAKQESNALIYFSLKWKKIVRSHRCTQSRR